MGWKAMPRLGAMRRIVQWTLSAISLLLCAAVGAAWIRSYWVRDALYRNFYWGDGNQRVSREMNMASNRGRVSARIERCGPYPIIMRDASGLGMIDLKTNLEWYWDHGATWTGALGSDFIPGHALRFEWRRDVQMLGIGYHHGTYDQYETWEFDLPYWALVAALAVAPSLAMATLLRRRRRLRRSGAGLCMECGYDLRASRERCPECGTNIPGVK
jgi:hypothetical protein